MTSRYHQGRKQFSEMEKFAPLVVTVHVTVTEQFSNGSILTVFNSQLRNLRVVDLDEICVTVTVWVPVST